MKDSAASVVRHKSGLSIRDQILSKMLLRVKTIKEQPVVNSVLNKIKTVEEMLL